MKTPLFVFMLPCIDNNRRSLEHVRRLFKADCLQVAKGYTALPICDGNWIGPNGHAYPEPMEPVQVACSEEQRDTLAAKMLERFHDQQAICIMQIGTAEIIDRPAEKVAA